MGKQRIKEIRMAHGYSQRDLAEKIGVSSSTVAMWETDKRAPRTKALKRLSELFNVSPMYILGESDNPDPHNSVKESPESDDDKLIIDPKEIEALQKYMTLDETGKATVDLIIDQENDRCETEGTSNKTLRLSIEVMKRAEMPPMEEFMMLFMEAFKQYNNKK